MRRVLVICAALAAGARAQQMDEISQKLLEGWDKAAYQLGRAGAKTCWFEISAKVTGMTGTMVTRGSYYWNGKRTWRYGVAPMHYPTHCTSQLVGVTGERLTEVVCHGWGDDSRILKDNVYGNPFWNE